MSIYPWSRHQQKYYYNVVCTCCMYMLYVHVVCTCRTYMSYVHVICTCTYGPSQLTESCSWRSRSFSSTSGLSIRTWISSGREHMQGSRKRGRYSTMWVLYIPLCLGLVAFKTEMYVLCFAWGIKVRPVHPPKLSRSTTSYSAWRGSWRAVRHSSIVQDRRGSPLWGSGQDHWRWVACQDIHINWYWATIAAFYLILRSA